MNESPDDTNVRPWHRELWPWLLMMPPALAVVGGIAMVWLAVQTPGVLIVEDYARIEALTADRFARDREAQRLGLSAELDIGVDTRRIELTLQAPPGFAMPAGVTLTLRHVSDADRDVDIFLARTGERFAAQSPLQPGRYYIELTDETRAWRLGASSSLPAASIRMQPQTDRT